MIDYALWELTQRCNLCCLHCRANAYLDVVEKDIVEGENIKKVIDQLVSVKCPVLALTGGEPLLREDIVDIVKYATTKGIRVRFQSNGLLLTKEMLLKLKKAGIFSIGIGLDGSNAKIHDFMRNKKGAFLKAIKVIKMIKENGVKVHVEYTVTNLNINDLHKTLDLLEKLKVDTFLARSVLFMGRATKLNKLFLIDPKKYFLFLKKLYKEKQKRKIILNCQDPLFHHVIPNYREQLSKYGDLDKGMVLTGCTVGLNMIHIRKNGDIGVCTFLPNITLGNILKEPLLDMWNNRTNNLLLKKIIDRNFCGNCGICRDKFICGGCRARAMALKGNVLESDPYCLNYVENKN